MIVAIVTGMSKSGDAAQQLKLDAPRKAGRPPPLLLRPNAAGLPGGCLRSSLPPALLSSPECHRLARWMLTFVATRRPCSPRPNATGSPGGCLRSSLPPALLSSPECHRLARWMLTLVATAGPALLA